MKRPVLIMTLTGAIVGLLVARAAPREWFSSANSVEYPLPHQVAKYPGGISLRFAMVHDVIHERYPKHGQAYYRHRNELVTRKLAALGGLASAKSPEDAHWPLLDDLAVGHVQLGQFDRAIAVAREKIARQEKLGILGSDLYGGYANLGTAMMIEALVNLSKPPGDAGAREQQSKAAIAELRESLVWVRKAIAVNPQAHFGREMWQVQLGTFLLAAAEDPKILSGFDMIGQPLIRMPRFEERYYTSGGIGAIVERTMSLAEPSEDQRRHIRNLIPIIGIDSSSAQKRQHAFQYDEIAFDEPVLGIVGMWRYGGGANIHFAIALGETMSRVGQRHIAWSAYERARRLLPSSGLDAKTAAALTEHCENRQSAIEAGDDMPANAGSRLRAAFDADLKAGLDYQAAYQAFEAERIAAGADIDDPNFYAAFHATHPDIASPPGRADFMRVERESFLVPEFNAIVLSAGVFAFATALIVRSRRARRLASTT